jgi:hypothetical protein
MAAAGRACLAPAPAIGAISAVITASIAIPGDPQRRIATVDCAVAN